MEKAIHYLSEALSLLQKERPTIVHDHSSLLTDYITSAYITLIQERQSLLEPQRQSVRQNQ